MPSQKLEPASPEALGLLPRKWEGVLEAAEKLCRRGDIPALALQVQRRGMTTGPHLYGSRCLERPVPVTDDTLFLVASLTKPIIAMATLLLVERGELSLNQRVVELLPEFHDAAKRVITIRHLLTHTSGLPDMLPNNQQLRMAQAPLSKFVEETCRTDLVFPPGRGAQYQSMGYALLGAIIGKVSGMSYSEFLRRELFEPLQMHQSWLGLPDNFSAENRIAEVRVPAEQAQGNDWNWNSPYWRRLGAPWGGLVTTVGDMSQFCRHVLAGYRSAEGTQFLSPVSLREATTNRLEDFPSLPESERRTRGWGYGWRMNWKDHRSSFCDLLSGDVFGHWGATGTLFWLEARREIAVVILSTAPLNEDVSPFTKLSNMIAAAFVDG